jgi:hypothetical protein
MMDLATAMETLSDNFATGYITATGLHELTIELIDSVIHHKHTFICTGVFYSTILIPELEDGYGVGEVIVTDDIDLVTAKAQELIPANFNYGPSPKWYIYLGGGILCYILCEDVEWTIGPP